MRRKSFIRAFILVGCAFSACFADARPIRRGDARGTAVKPHIQHENRDSRKPHIANIKGRGNSSEQHEDEQDGNIGAVIGWTMASLMCLIVCAPCVSKLIDNIGKASVDKRFNRKRVEEASDSK